MKTEFSRAVEQLTDSETDISCGDTESDDESSQRVVKSNFHSLKTASTKPLKRQSLPTLYKHPAATEGVNSASDRPSGGDGKSIKSEVKPSALVGDKDSKLKTTSGRKSRRKPLSHTATEKRHSIADGDELNGEWTCLQIGSYFLQWESFFSYLSYY